MSTDFSPDERVLIRGEEVAQERLQSLRGWYPVVVKRGRLWWRFLGDKKFREPFFFDTVCSLRHEQPLCLQTSFDALDRLDDTLEPTVFVFHISRCGSTLLTQLFASLAECIVLSEPTTIDSFLHEYYAGQHCDDAVLRLRQLVSALGHRRFPEECHLIIKLDSWHIASLPLFRRAFPDTPFLFLYRDPAEVMASHRRQRGRQMVPGMVTAAMPALDFDWRVPGDLDGYCAKMLEYFFDMAVGHVDELLFIDYRQLPHLVWEELLALLNITPSHEHLAEMKSRSGLHSKRGEQFSGAPQALAANDGEQYPALDACYVRMEQLRRRQNRFRSATA